MLSERHDAHAADARGEQAIYVFQREARIFQGPASTLSHDLVLSLVGRPAQRMLVDPRNNSFSFNAHDAVLSVRTRQLRHTLLVVSQWAANGQPGARRQAWSRQYDREATH